MLSVRSDLAAWQVMVNLDTTQPLLGQATSRLKSMHNGQGCLCDVIPVHEIRINHYLGSRGDYRDKTKRYWQVSDVVVGAAASILLLLAFCEARRKPEFRRLLTC